MANWYGTARSNTVRIKDVVGLDKALEPFSLWVKRNGNEFTFFGEDDSGGWPSYGILTDETEEEEKDTEVAFDPAIHIAPFMEDDQILIMMCVGAEKLRFVTGYAQAYNAKGKYVAINLDQIYRKAALKFKVPIEKIDAAEY